MNGEASFRPWSSLANQAALGAGRVDAAFLTEPVPYEDFEYSSGVDYPNFTAPPPASSSTAGASHLFRPFSPFHANAASSSPRSRTASFPGPPPPHSGTAPEPAPLFDSTESALFSSFLTTLDVDPAFLFNPVLPPGMPSPPSTSAGPYGGGASERDRHERDSLGRDVGGMHLRASTASGETASSTTSAGSTPRSSFALGGAAHIHGAYLPPATLTAGPPPLPPTTLTAGPPPPPPLSLRLPTPPRAARDDDSREPRAHGRARGATTARYAELDEEDEDEEARRDSDSDFEPAREGGVGSGSGSGATGAAASAGMRRRTRNSGGGGAAAAAAAAAPPSGSRRGAKKARVSEVAPVPEAGDDVDMEMLEDEPALAAGLAAGRAKRNAATARRGGGRASLSRLPDPVGDYGALDGGVDPTSAGAALPTPPAASTSTAAAPAPTRSGNGKPVTLTESQKRSNHILSEQKRRNAIRIGFKDLVGLLLAGEPASGIVLGSSGGAAGDDDDEGGAAPTAKKRKSKGTGSGRGRGRRGDVSTNASKSVVLTHAASYILWLERGNMALEQEVARVEALLREAHVEP
ncbi:hypothetical protein JCM8208_006275 [Rhodotorula glutinis]